VRQAMMLLRTMTPTERKEKLDSIAHTLFAMSQELSALLPQLPLETDRKAAENIITDLHWGSENCTVIGLHQIGKALEDQMCVDSSTDK
jgi:hypothetical protein